MPWGASGGQGEGAWRMALCAQRISGPVKHPQKLFIRLKVSIPGVQTTFYQLHNIRHFAAFSADLVHLKKPSRWPEGPK
jgi:hypothetical protein